MLRVLTILLLLITLSSYGQKYVIGTIQSQDPDSSQRMTYSLVSGNLGGYFGITASGILYVDVKAYDSFAESRSWDLRVACRDDGIMMQKDGRITFEQSIGVTRIVTVTLQKRDKRYLAIKSYYL